MQISSIPPPILTNTLPQDAIAKAVPNLQAAAPLIPNAVKSPPKSEKFNQSRNNKDRHEGGGDKEDGADGGDKTNDKRGGSINFSV